MKKILLTGLLSILATLYVTAQNLTDIRADIRQTMDEFCTALSNLNNEILTLEQGIQKFKLFEPQMEPRVFTFEGERNLTLPEWVSYYVMTRLVYIHVTHTLDITDFSLCKVSESPSDQRYTFDGVMKREFLSIDEEFITDEFPVSFTVIWSRKGKLVEITEIKGSWPAMDKKYRSNASHALEMLTNGQLQEGMDMLLQMAEKGNVGAQYGYGMINYEGTFGVEPNHRAAGKWMEKAASKGFAMAQFYMGEFHFYGHCGYKKNHSIAREWYEKAAEQDVPEAKTILGYMYTEGLGGLAKDSVKALDLYTEASAQGHIVAQHELGLWYMQGLCGLQPDEGKALELWTIAANQGDVDSQYKLGYHYTRLIKIDHGGYTTREFRNLLEGIDWLKKACEQNHLEAMYYLAELYHSQSGLLGVKQSDGLDLWKKASDLGHLPSMYELGLKYLESNQPELTTQCIELWTLAAEQGYVQAQYHLGLILKVSNKDYKTAVYWTECAAKKGHSVAQFNLGSWYMNGEAGLPKSYKDALYWLTESHNDRYMQATILLGDLYYNWNPKNAHKAVECWNNYPHALTCQFRLGVCHFYGEGGLDKDEQKGLQMITEAARYLDEAKEWLDDYNELQAGLEKARIKKEIEKEYQQKAVVSATPAPAPKRQYTAAEKRQIEDYYLIGNQYYFGTYPYKKNPQLTVNYWQRAAEHGHIKAQCELGTLYYNGECGLPRSPELAEEWWKRSAEQGYAKAQFNLGSYYFKNLKQNKGYKELSRHWLKKAALQGHTKAAELLKNKKLR